jgi:zinc/manganese transport system substrate-binding protein
MTRNESKHPTAAPRRLSLLLAALVAFAMPGGGLLAPAQADKGLDIITTTEDLAAIAREVAGDKAQVASLSHGYQDPHFVDAKPSYMVQLRKADLFVEVGRELEVGWAPSLVNGARNPKILAGAPGHVDASTHVQVVEIPGQVSRSEGDVHPFGNPHYWEDPANAAPIAREIRDGLIRVDGKDAAYFTQRTADFEKRLAAGIARWKAQAQSLGLAGMKVVTYHRSWSYFARAYGLDVVNFIEPRPGIPPSPNHVADLEAQLKQGGVRMILMEPFYDPRVPQKIARDTNVPLVVLPSSVGAEPAIRTIFDLYDRQLALLAQALKGGKS